MRNSGKTENPKLAEEKREARSLVGRRALLRGALLSAGVAAAGAGAVRAEDSVGADAPEWMKTPGRPLSGYGTPSHWQEKVQRIFTIAPGRGGTGSSRTPLHQLEGTITPNGLHYERHHNGVPDIDPARHELFIHGMVKRPLAFSLDALMRYPMETRIHFLECSGNSGVFSAPQPQQMTAGELNGLLSCSEWTGVRLSTLLAEAGVTKEAKWVVAEGADAAAMSRSIPLEKCMDDAMIALYQNGEAIRPEQGFPMRLLLPGFEGNMNVKWLRRLNVIDVPVDARDETSHYTELMPGGKARQFMFPQAAKSVIVKPSFGMTMKGSRPLRDFRTGMVGRGTRLESGGLDERRQDLGCRAAGRAGFAGVSHPLPHAVAVGRETHDADEPRHGRGRRHAANPRELGGSICAGPAISLQRHSDLEYRGGWDGEKCLRVD